MPIPIATQVLAFLQYAAGNSFQLHIADSLGISQKSLSNCINRVATSLADQADQFIHFPENADKIRQAKAAFSNHGFCSLFQFCPLLFTMLQCDSGGRQLVGDF